jgi:hypothetical protein
LGVGFGTGFDGFLGVGGGGDFEVIFCVFLLEEGGNGRFGGGTVFLDVGIGGFLAGAAFVALFDPLFCDSRNAFLLAASVCVAPFDGRATARLRKRRSGMAVARNRGNTVDT